MISNDVDSLSNGIGCVPLKVLPFLVKRVHLTRMIRPTYELYAQRVVMLTGVRKCKFDVGRGSVDTTGLVLAKKEWKN